MKLKHYKGNDWEIKVKYDEEIKGTVWKDRQGVIPPSKYYGIVDAININCQGIYFDYMLSFNHLIEHLDNLTKPKIINEREFKNDNFHIKVWETEDKIGAETVWIREGFEYGQIKRDEGIMFARGWATSLRFTMALANFGLFKKKDEVLKEELTYTYTDLCTLLEKAEQETSELTYDTVVKELEGLEGIELMKALKNYEFAYANRPHFWQSLADFSAKGLFVFLNLQQAVERGLIKLRRVK